MMGHRGLTAYAVDGLRPPLILGNLVRASILYFLALSEVRKEDLLQRLDRAVFDRGEIEELRTRANQYWGLKGSTEERIHSARWGAGAA
jgi:hypothetical protein